MNPTITPEVEDRISALIGQFLDNLIAEFGDIETAARKIHTYNTEGK